MLTLSTRNQIAIGLALVLLMVATRDHHFSLMLNLPGASWAIFFLAGVYLRSAWPLLGFLVLSWSLDFAAYAWGEASAYCLTPAYAFLLPAYAALWLAGRWYALQHQFEWRTLLPLALSMLVGLSLCELLSSGGFYFFSGRFDETTFIEFGQRLIKFFPLYVESFLFYIVIAAVLHSVIKFTHNLVGAGNTAAN